MGRSTRKKAKPWRQPEPLLRLDDESRNRLLDAYNVRCEIEDIAFLRDPQFARHDVDGYCFVGETLYAIDRSVNFIDDRGVDRLPLRRFLGHMPVVFDLTELFAGQVVGEQIPFTEELQLEVSNRLEQARQLVINEWIAALKMTPDQMNLEQLLRKMKPLSQEWLFASDAVIFPVVEKMDADREWDVRWSLYDVMRRESIRMPEWSGLSDEVEWRVWQMNDVRRRSWTQVHGGGQGRTSICATVRLDAGPLAIVINSTGTSAKEKAEKLITDKAYGDVVLLEGPEAAVKAQAQRLNTYLYGVDIIEARDNRFSEKPRLPGMRRVTA
jgi:hypothetical protein